MTVAEGTASATSGSGGADDDGVAAIATALAGASPTSITRVGGGRNSRVFRIDTAGSSYALKQYPALADDPRDRLGTEAAALVWMAEQGFETVPRFVAADRRQNFALLSWAEGALVRDPVAADVGQALAFLAQLHDRRRTPAIGPERLAAEACLSAAEIERQLRSRVERLSALADTSLSAFLSGELVPKLERTLAAARDELARAGIGFDAELPLGRRSLVPSDFGYHNALRDAAGRLTFIDFEYFGWDDPVKLTADVLLHPGTDVSVPLRHRFREGAEAVYSDDAMFAPRLAALLPLFGLRWALILLNEFHPERWRRRLLAGATDDWATVKRRQIEAARRMLNAHAL